MQIKKIAQSSGVVATVVDNLTSTSTTNALSANQGKVLYDGKLDIATFKYRNLTANVTVPSLANMSVNMGSFETIPTGYMILGIVPVSNGFSDQWTVTYALYGTNVMAYIKSYYGGSLSSSIQCRIIYIYANSYNGNVI